jgi:hypothetical protein
MRAGTGIPAPGTGLGPAMRRPADGREHNRRDLRHGHRRRVPCRLRVPGPATRQHNRISVRPFLELRVGVSQGRTAGLQLINAGLGPAVITGTVLMLDGQPLGEFSEASVNVLRGKLSIRPAAVTFRRPILASGYDQFLLSITSFDQA